MVIIKVVNTPSLNLLGFKSTPMILDAPAILAPSAAYIVAAHITFRNGTYDCNTREHYMEILGTVSIKLTARPTAPSPNTATVEPFFGLATFRVAPKPEQYKEYTNVLY